MARSPHDKPAARTRRQGRTTSTEAPAATHANKPTEPAETDWQAVATALVDWYRAHQRDLPWRRQRDPYAIWVSEIMLQQTRVETVRGYYERWMARFPTVEALASAPTDDVLSAWSGLGYYARARNLQSAAREVVASYGGTLPRSAAELQRLAGVGPYTAGAIASIAYGEPAPIVDGNVARVLSRVALLDDNVRAPATQRELWRLAKEIVERAPPEEVNQALMELGALVCTPQRPACLTCPVSTHCAARRLGRQEELPLVLRKSKVPTVELAAAWLVDPHDRVLLLRREPTGLFGGLWELPTVELDSADPTDDNATDNAIGDRARRDSASVDGAPRAALERAVARYVGLRLTVREELGTVEHVLTHRRLKVRAFRCSLRDVGSPNPAVESSALNPIVRPSSPYDDARWVTRSSPSAASLDLASLGLSSLTARLLEGRYTARPEPGNVPRSTYSLTERREDSDRP